MLFAPASASFRIPMICSSVNRFRFIAGPPRGLPAQADSHAAWHSFRGAGRTESAGPFEEGLRLYEAGRRQEAIPYFDRAIAADPKRKEAWLYRGRAYGETKNDGEAFRSYEQALRLDHRYAEAFFPRGRTYLWESSPERAIREST